MLWLELIVLCFGLYFSSLTLLVAGVNRNEDPRHSTSAPGGRIFSKVYSRKSHNHHHHHPHPHHQQHHHHTTSSRQHQGDSADDGKESTKLRMQLKENSGKSVVALEDGYTKRRDDGFYGDRAQQTETSIDRQISVYTPEGHSSKDNKHNNNNNNHNINKNNHHHKNKNHNKNNHPHNSKNNNTNTTTNTNNKNKNHNNINNNAKHKDNGTSLPNKCPKCRQRDNQMQLRMALLKDNILKYLGLSTEPDIQDPSIPQIPTVQHAISGHTMQKDSPFHSVRKQDFNHEFGGHTLRPLQRILVSHPLSNSSFSNLTNTFQFSLKLLPYMYSIKKAILWLYLRPVQTSEEEGFSVLEVNCLSTNKSLRSRKVKLERNGEGKGKWNTFETTKLIKKRLIAKDENIQMQASANNKYGINHIVLLSDYHESRGYKPYLEIQMVPNRRKRSKRGVGLQCDATKVENRCCLYPMEVTFADFGWNWIIIPSTYRANYCSGECDIKLLQDYAHTSMVSNLKQNTSQIICCTPTALSSLSLLYFNDDAVIEQRDLPNMIVDSCGCR